eukprot:TRINITY_DN16592_c0_g1_i4.p1 TRINITY_DN16592_c0_g1~~TRINITY_DN16592_c0_g1_i4.p1  ORF type:complete len:1109 (-),score=328.00 TRINITY_DN16592_c0_g1_i4:69-3395(-)
MAAGGPPPVEAPAAASLGDEAAGRAPSAATAGALVSQDDGEAGVGETDRSALRLLLNHGDPALAAGGVVFGVGLLVLPLLSRLNSLAPEADLLDEDGVFSYETHSEQNKEQPLRIFSEGELRRRFGRLDVATVGRELAKPAGELEEYVRQCDVALTDDEVVKLHRWRNRANARLGALRRRSALSFLGLPPNAGDSDVSKVYKKMALELHPDKGGDPAKFQALQDMKERLSGSPTAGNDSDGEGPPPGETKKQEEKENGTTSIQISDSEDDADEKADEEDEDKKDKRKQRLEARSPMEIQQDRVEIHQSVLRLWERARKIHQELSMEAWGPNSPSSSSTAPAPPMSDGGSSAGSLAADALDDAEEPKRKPGVDARPAINGLRRYLQHFVATELRLLRPGDAKGAMGTLRKFLHGPGAELAAVAAVANLSETKTMLAIHLSSVLMARSDSPAVRNACEAFHKALDEVPRLATRFLVELEGQPALQERCRQPPSSEDSGAAEQKPAPEAADRVSKREEPAEAPPSQLPTPPEAADADRGQQPEAEASAATISAPQAKDSAAESDRDPPKQPQQPPREEEQPQAKRQRGGKRQASKQKPGLGRNEEQAAAKARKVKLHTSFEDEKQVLVREDSSGTMSHLVFEPPPLKCGKFELRLRLEETRRGREDVRAMLREDPAGPEVALLRGLYALRGEGEDFQATFCREACASGLSALFDAGGAPKVPLLGYIGAKALSGGIFLLDEVSIDGRLRGRDIGLDFFEAVLRCLAGPMKRVTLVVCRLGPLPEALRRHWTRIGFRQATTGGDDASAAASPQEAFSKEDVSAWWFLEPGRNGWRRKGKAHKAEKASSTTSASQQAGGAKRKGRSQERKTQLEQRVETATATAQVASAAAAAGAPVEAATAAAAPPEPRKKAKVSVLPPSVNDSASRMVGGMTPRMRYVLVAASDKASQTLRDDAENNFVNGKPGGKHWGQSRLPPELQGRVFKAFVRGMAEVTDAFGFLLRKRKVPTTALMNEVLSPVLSPMAQTAAKDLGLHPNRQLVSHFFAKGGQTDHVVQAILDSALAFYEEREDDDDEAREGQPHGRYHGLPMHMLDGDFDYVRSILLPSADDALG